MNEVILVTGGAGFIGSHVCKSLACQGYTPWVFDNLTAGHRDAVLWGPFTYGDILDRLALDSVIAEARPSAVIHLAGLAYVGESVRSPSEYYRTNVRGTLELLDAMRCRGVENIVFSSTCATYGVPEKLPITEMTPQNPINPYGFTKLTAERALRDYRRGYGISFAILRYFNAAGADPDGELGERHDPETHILPRAIRSALGLEPCFEIFGDDYSTPDGTAVRDYVHVSDLAKAHVLAVQMLLATANGLEVNLSTGRGTSVLEIVAAVERISGVQINWTLRPRRTGDPPMLYADSQAAEKLLKWVPSLSSLDTIIATAYRWFALHQAKAGE